MRGRCRGRSGRGRADRPRHHGGLGGGRGGAADRPAAGARRGDLLRVRRHQPAPAGLPVRPGARRLAAEMSMALDDRVPRAKAIVAQAGRRRATRSPGSACSTSSRTAPPSAGRTSPTRWWPRVSSPTATRPSTTLLHDDRPFFVGHYYVDALRAVQLVARGRRGAGLRPPGGGDARHDRRRRRDPRDGRGRAGRARGRPPRQRARPTGERLRALAGELGLLVTGASDYHGAGKDNRLGEHTTDPAVLEALLGQVTSGVAPVSSCSR